MKKYSPISVFFCVLALCSCGQASNPLQQHDPKEVATFLFEHANPVLRSCGLIWANPDQANATVIKTCEEAAFYVATLLEKEGYGKITSKNAKLKTIWMEFNRIGEERDRNRKPFQMEKW